MKDVSGTGLSVWVKASKTFPQGILCTAFADDTDPMEVQEVTITESGMGLNGDLVTYSSPQPIQYSLSLIPGTEEQLAMAFLLEANRVAKGKKSANDEITIVINYADGTRTTLTPGRITGGLPMNGVASDGRTKTPTYNFVFENKV